MKLKLMAVGTATVLALVGCQGTTTDNQEGRGDRDTNVEQTRYNDNNQNRMNTRDGITNTRDGERDNRDNRNFGANDRRGDNYNNTDRRHTQNDNRYDVAEEAADKI